MTTEAEKALEPCAHCGSENMMVLGPTCTKASEYDPADTAFPRVRCMSCGCEVPGKDWDASLKSAIAGWNRRAPNSFQNGNSSTARAKALEDAEAEVERLKKTAFWLAQVAGGCEEIECADFQSDNCHCMNRFVGMYRAAAPVIKEPTP